MLKSLKTLSTLLLLESEVQAVESFSTALDTDIAVKSKTLSGSTAEKISLNMNSPISYVNVGGGTKVKCSDAVCSKKVADDLDGKALNKEVANLTYKDKRYGYEVIGTALKVAFCVNDGASGDYCLADDSFYVMGVTTGSI